MIHELKTDPDLFELTIAGLKPFEIRKLDRDFQVGDMLRLKETCFSAEQMSSGMPLAYSGRTHDSEVIAMVHGKKYGILPDHVLLLTKR